MWDENTKYSDLYQKYAESIEKYTTETISRSLTEQERKAIWNVGSYRRLEAIDQRIYCAANPDEIIATLDDWFKSNVFDFDYDFNHCIQTLEKLLNRNLINPEKAKLYLPQSTVILMRIQEQIQDSEENQRENHFQEFLIKEIV